MREVKAGRGSPHGGVFLDISWIKEKLPNAAEHIKQKLPSMYHQFKQLADIDITEEPMEVGPTTHYMMGGIRVDGDTQMSDRARPVCGRRMCGGSASAPIAWAEIRCPICWSSASGPANMPPSSRRKIQRGNVDKAQIDEAARDRSRRSNAARAPRVRIRCNTICRK